MAGLFITQEISPSQNRMSAIKTVKDTESIAQNQAVVSIMKVH